MKIASLVGIVGAVLISGTSLPAQAQIFWQSPDFSGTALTEGEAGIGVTLAGATVAEERANWVWQFRSALDVARLQCKFSPVLMTEDNYNGVLRNHAVELNKAYTTLRGYFARVSKKGKAANVKAAQAALDSYGDRTYNGYSTVSSQYGFCQTASRLGRSAQFAAPGSLTVFAAEHLRSLRNSLQPAGEQLFRRTHANYATAVPDFDNRCWDRRGLYLTKCPMIAL